MSGLLAQVQQLLTRASSQSLTTAQLSQILSVLAAGSSADPTPSPVVPPITSPTLVITPPPTITFSPISTVPCPIPVSPSVPEIPTVPVEDVPAVPVSDTPEHPLMLPLVYSLTSGEFSNSYLLFYFLSFVFVLGSLLSADTTVRSSLSLHFPSCKQHYQPIAMRAASSPHKHRLRRKHSLTPSLVEVSEPEPEAIFSSPLLPSPKHVSRPKRTVNCAPMVDTTPRSVILPNKKSKTMVSTQLCNGSSLSEVSPSGMFSFCSDFSLLTLFISLGHNIVSLFGLVAGHPYLDLIPALFVPPSCEELVRSLFLSCLISI